MRAACCLCPKVLAQLPVKDFWRMGERGFWRLALAPHLAVRLVVLAASAWATAIPSFRVGRKPNSGRREGSWRRNRSDCEESW